MGSCTSRIGIYTSRYEVWLSRARRDGRQLRNAPEDLRKNKVFVFDVVKVNWRALAYAAKELQKDNDLVGLVHQTTEYQTWLLRVLQDKAHLKDVPRELQADKQLVLEAVTRDGRDLEHAVGWLQRDTDVVMEALKQNGDALEFTSFKKKDKEFVLEAIKQKGHAYCYASHRLRNDKEILIEAVKKDPMMVNYALEFGALSLRSDKEIMMLAVGINWRLRRHAEGGLINDKDIIFHTWLSRVIEDAEELQRAPAALRDDKIFIIEACKQNWLILEFAAYHFRNDKQVITEAINHDCWAIKYAADSIRDDNEVMSKVVQKDGGLLRFASKRVRKNKHIVLQAVKKRGIALQHADSDLQKDKDVVIAAVLSNADAFKFALGDTKQDKDCLIAAGIWDANYDSDGRKRMITKKVALSTRFSLMPESEFEATNFTKLFKSHGFVRDRKFDVYSPNVFDKSTCDPDWTNFDYPCRGTKETCHYDNVLTKAGRPTNSCCWRYSFRYQLEEAKNSGGFMLQLVEAKARSPQELGDGQRIEKDMAEQIGTKIFRVHRPRYEAAQLELSFSLKDIEKVISEIQKWYNDGCKDMSECTIHFPRKL